MRTNTRSSLAFALLAAASLSALQAQPGHGPISGGGGGAGGAPTTVDFLVKTASGDLSAERVCTDSATATWDFATAGQAKLTVVDLACTACIGGTEIDESSLVGVIGGSTGATDNAILAADGTGGATLQTRAITISDVSGFLVTLASTPGNALALAATAPEATTGASQAGKAASLTASAAVASTDTAGAAAGGAVTITAGAAARNTSGNANGGNISFMPGAGIGTGVSGNVGVGVTDPSRTFAVNGRAVIGDGNIGNLDKQGILDIFLDSSLVTGLSSPTRWNSIVLGYVNGVSDSLALGIINGVGPFLEAHSGNPLTIITGNSEFATFGSDHILSLTGWASTYGKNALSADATNATATMANLYGLSATLVAGRKYVFEMNLFLNDSVAGEGVAVDFAGGTATATTFRANCQLYDAALLLSATSTALATDFAAATVTGDAALKCNGSFVVNAGGTFIPRASQNSHSTGTLTTASGSHLILEDVSFN